jgi:hypothetical protein
MLTGGFVLFVAVILVGLGYIWGYGKGKINGKLDGRADGFRAHEDLVFGRIHSSYPEQADDMIENLLA